MAKTITIGNLSFAVKASVTRSVMQLTGKSFIQVQGPIHQAPKTEGGREQLDDHGNPLPPPDVMDVLDLSDGEEKIIVVNKVLGSVLREKYEGDSYIGRLFMLEKFKPEGKKRYATFSVLEIEQTENAAPEETQAPAIEQPKIEETATEGDTTNHKRNRR